MWKAIPYLKGHYEVNECGDVRRVGKSNVLRHSVDRIGYHRVKVYLDGREFRTSVHRAVATAFIPNINNYPCVNHIDGDKSNNTVSNLEWCTHSQNCIHANRTGLRKHPLTLDDVEAIRRTYVPRKKGCTQYDLAKRFGVSQQTISDILLNKYWVT